MDGEIILHMYWEVQYFRYKFSSNGTILSIKSQVIEYQQLILTLAN